MEANNYADRNALITIINDCDMIYMHIERLGVSRQTMLVDQTCLDAVSKRIENIGEVVYESCDARHYKGLMYAR